MSVASEQAACSKKCKRRLVRGLLIIGGTICLALGAVGIFMPILPTTPFLLVAAACYLRSSDKLHKWLLNNRWFGEYIRNYQEGRGIPMKTKILAITILWGTILFSAFYALNEILIAQIALIAIAVGVSAHLIRLPTLRK